MSTKATRNIVIYAASVALVSGTNFALTPFLIWIWGPAKFASWALIEPIILMMVPIAGLGLNIGILGLLQKHSRRGVVSMTHGFHILSCFALGIISIFIILFLGLGVHIAMAVSFIIFSEGALIYWLAYWRGTENAGGYIITDGLRAALVLIAIASSAIAAPILVRDVEGYLTIRAIISCVTFIVILLVIRPKLAFRWRAIIKPIRFGLPIVLASSTIAIVSNFDRYPVLWAEGATAVAIYVAHTRIAQLLNTAASPFFIWFAPKAMKAFVDKRDQDFFAKSFSVYFVIVSALSVGLWVLIPGAWPFLFPEIVLDRWLLFWLLAGAIAFALGNPLSAGTLKPGSSVNALVVTASALAFGGGAALVLSIHLGADGAALGRFIAFTWYCIHMALVSKKAGVPILNYPWPAIALAATCSLLIASCAEIVLGGNIGLFARLGGALAASGSVLLIGFWVMKGFRRT